MVRLKFDMLDSIMKENLPIQLSDCQLKQARRGNQMEVMLTGSNVSSCLEFEDNNPKEISLDHLESIELW